MRHILRHQGKGAIFSEKVKTTQKKNKKCTEIHKNKDIFTIFEKGTLMHVTIACMKVRQ